MVVLDVCELRSQALESEYLSRMVQERLSGSHDVPEHIRVKNRRKRYLELHPDYFGPQLELADPLLYDRLIRRFQTKAERESEGRAKGYSGVLEADLWRGEAKLNALRNPNPDSEVMYKRGRDGEILAEEKDEIPPSKEEGIERWRDEMERRFLRGHDPDFDYSAVDDNADYDDVKLEEREEEERYFDTETPAWVDEDGASEASDRKLVGETGIQDF